MGFEIVDDKLEINGKPAPFVKAKFFGARFHPNLIIYHDTADHLYAGDTVQWFANPDKQVSAHFVVERDGSVTQMVPCDHKAFHAGASCWGGKQGCNNFAIGIEIDNPGALDKDGRAWFHKTKKPYQPGFPLDQIVHKKTKEHGDAWWMPYTPEQIATVTELSIALVEAYPTIREAATHWLISPGRKVDTNPLFPLDEVRAAVFKKKPAPVGRPLVYPQLQLGDHGDGVRAAQEKLQSLGYPVGDCDGTFGPQMRVAVLAFEAENNLVYDAVLNPSEHKMLMTDASVKAMPVGARADISEKDLAARGSETILWVNRARRIIFGIPLIGGLFGGADATVNDGAGTQALLDQVAATRQQAVQVSDIFGWVITPAGLITIAGLAVLGVLLFILDRIAKRRVEDARSGKNVAR